jgi:hypothetical protein
MRPAALFLPAARITIEIVDLPADVRQELRAAQQTSVPVSPQRRERNVGPLRARSQRRSGRPVYYEVLDVRFD